MLKSEVARLNLGRLSAPDLIRQPATNLQLQQGAHVANVAAVQDDVTAN